MNYLQNNGLMVEIEKGLKCAQQTHNSNQIGRTKIQAYAINF